MNSYYTYKEIKTQTKAWENALGAVAACSAGIKQLTAQYKQVVFTGCGSTYYLSLAGAALYQTMTGKTARAVPGSELLLNTSSISYD